MSRITRRQPFTQLLVQHPLTQAERRVLDFLIAQSRSNGGVVALGSLEMATSIGIHNDTVKRALKRLVSGGFVQRARHQLDGRRWTYNLSPNVTWDSVLAAAS